MLRSLILYWTLLASLVLSGCAASAVPNEPPYHSYLQADCAPWDGAAFTLSIPFDTGRTARVTIYDSPDLPRRTTFTFPDPTGRVGNASYFPEFGPELSLSGHVTFDSVRADVPSEGTFDLRSSNGLLLQGRFNATWTDRRALCG